MRAIVVDDEVYMLELESAYFLKTKKDECEYLVNLLRKLAEWMDSQEISRNEKLAIWDGITFVSRSVENLYAQFLCYVNGYCALYGDDESPSQNAEFVEYTSWSPID